MSESIRIKIRKLLALAGNNPNEHEAKVALEKAHALMLEHGINEVGDDPDHIKIRRGDCVPGMYKANWHRHLARSVSRLYGCSHIFGTRANHGLYRFVGMNHQLEAAEETFIFIAEQIESLYKTALKAFDGKLDKVQRAELRASFKDAAAVRISVRVSKILNDRKPEGKALVVVDTIKEKIDDNLGDIKRSKLPAVRDGFGSGAGFNAGGLVRIQKEVPR